MTRNGRFSQDLALRPPWGHIWANLPHLGEAATLVLWGAGRCVPLVVEGKKYLSRAQGHSAWGAWPHLQWPVCKTTLSLSFPGAGWVAGSPELRRFDNLDLLGAHPTETGAPDGHEQGSSEGAIVV